MSRENVEVLRRAYEAFVRGDIEATIAAMDEDIEWVAAITPMLGIDAVRGKEGVRRFLTRDIFEGFDEFSAEPQSFEDFGDKILVQARYVGRGESSGLVLDQVFHTVFTLRGGKVVAMRDYTARTEALEAVGLRE